MIGLLRKPSAWVPMMMSFFALTVLLGYVVLFGTAQQEDEGTAARIFQLLMIAQAPIIAFFGFKWIFRYPAQTILIILLQIVAALVPLVTLFLFEM